MKLKAVGIKFKSQKNTGTGGGGGGIRPFMYQKTHKKKELACVFLGLFHAKQSDGKPWPELLRVANPHQTKNLIPNPHRYLTNAHKLPPNPLHWSSHQTNRFLKSPKTITKNKNKNHFRNHIEKSVITYIIGGVDSNDIVSGSPPLVLYIFGSFEL